MKKSKFFLLVLSVLLVLGAMLALSACKKENGECAHEWGEYITMKEPTCLAEGAKVRTCALCGHAEAEKLPKGEHAYIGIITPPTCADKGYTTLLCICGATKKTDEVAVAAHNYVLTSTTNPTCTAKGYSTYTCTYCNRNDFQDYVDEIPHEYAKESVVTPPDCETKGFTTHYCVCPATKVDTYTHVAGHLPGAWQQDAVSGDYYAICERNNCGERIYATEGLDYELQPDDTYYVTGIGAAETDMIVIPTYYGGKAVTGIAADAFYGTEIYSVDIPETVTFIGANAFYACGLLEDIRVAAANTVYRTTNACLVEIATNKLLLARSGQIPEGVVTIAAYAFSHSKVTSVSIPASVTTVEKDAFYRAAQLVEITVAEGNTVYSGGGNCLIETATNTLVLGCAGSVIPNTVLVIAPYAFSDIRTLSNVSIPDSVVQICENAFYNCPMVFEEVNGAYYVDGWMIHCDANVATLTVADNLRGFADGSLATCTALTHIRFAGTSENWKNNVTLFTGWDDSIVIICSDGLLVGGILQDGDDRVDDPFA